MNENEFRFDIHDAVWYNDEIARVEDKAVDVKGQNIYLIQTASHRYHYVYEEDLQIYIG